MNHQPDRVDWQHVQSSPAHRHPYVGTGERCRLCDFTPNHVLHGTP